MNASEMLGKQVSTWIGDQERSDPRFWTNFDRWLKTLMEFPDRMNFQGLFCLLMAELLEPDDSSYAQEHKLTLDQIPDFAKKAYAEYLKTHFAEYKRNHSADEYLGFAQLYGKRLKQLGFRKEDVFEYSDI